MDGFKELTSDNLTKPDGIAELNRMFKTLFDYAAGDAKSVKIFIGYLTPEGAVVASPGSVFLRKDGAAATTLYVKTSGTGATGWTAK